MGDMESSKKLIKDDTLFLDTELVSRIPADMLQCWLTELRNIVGWRIEVIMMNRIDNVSVKTIIIILKWGNKIEKNA